MLSIITYRAFVAASDLDPSYAINIEQIHTPDRPGSRAVITEDMTEVERSVVLDISNPD
jgi:hypothetical protein